MTKGKKAFTYTLAERFSQTQPASLAKQVPDLKLPTLILWGDCDRLIPPDIGDRFHKEIAGSKLVRFNELGHVPQEEDPTRTVTALKEFLVHRVIAVSTNMNLTPDAPIK